MSRSQNPSSGRRHIARPLIAVVTCAVFGFGPSVVLAQVRERPPLQQPDSLTVLPAVYGATDTSRVVGRQLTLREIIELCVEGERSKLGGHENMTYTITVRAVICWKKRKELHDIVYRKYADSEGWFRTIELAESIQQLKLQDGEWIIDHDESREKAHVREESDSFSDFVEMPFFLEEQQEFDCELLGRTVEVDHVVLKIGFKPKSEFKALPSGIVYVDTDEDRIIHEEFEFDANPFPMFVKDIGRVSRHWSNCPAANGCSRRS